MTEPISQFEERKRDHIALALKKENEALGQTGLAEILLKHEALPELDFKDIEIKTTILGEVRQTPFLVSSMTAGHAASKGINTRIARACAVQGWLMGVGSQRRELFDSEAKDEWRLLRASAPTVKLLGNLGLTQAIYTSTDKIKELVDTLEAIAMIIHLNPLQESLQPEGTPNFRGGLKRLTELSRELSVPVVVKETGCGFSIGTLRKLKETGIAAVDVSGYGGTHWGRIEGQRSGNESVQAEASLSFSNWGVNTRDCLMAAAEVSSNYEVWASGGIRSGLDAAKTVALGAKAIGFAKPMLQAAMVGEDFLLKKMMVIEHEFKTALFCTGCQNPVEFFHKKVWKWQHQTT
ncbi:MAG: type 2 isopentenyl-diphosphate Delta-isomerase [Bdellovibrionales bacterium RBG_16_40_8]|nr:MAG: type 2 isopentenyl-diphosphate Delta-isomerase [Bdellovibrionales bacterium RBG_16_40_8]